MGRQPGNAVALVGWGLGIKWVKHWPSLAFIAYLSHTIPSGEEFTFFYFPGTSNYSQRFCTDVIVFSPQEVAKPR